MFKDQQPYVIVEHHHQWLEITLNRPDSFNALSQQMMHHLQMAIDLANTQEDLTCIIIKAKGKAFAQGMTSNKCRPLLRQIITKRYFISAATLCNPLWHAPFLSLLKCRG